MKVADAIAYSLAKPGATETYPWGDGELVAKVGDKAFVFIGLDAATIGVKCGANADVADEWRRRYPDDVTASSYIGRFGWNTVRLGGAVPDAEVRDLIDTSYAAIVAKLPRAKRPVVGNPA